MTAKYLHGDGDVAAEALSREEHIRRKKQQYANNVKSRSMDSNSEMQDAFRSTGSNASRGGNARDSSGTSAHDAQDDGNNHNIHDSKDGVTGTPNVFNRTGSLRNVPDAQYDRGMLQSRARTAARPDIFRPYTPDDFAQLGARLRL